MSRSTSVSGHPKALAALGVALLVLRASGDGKGSMPPAPTGLELPRPAGDPTSSSFAVATNRTRFGWLATEDPATRRHAGTAPALAAPLAGHPRRSGPLARVRIGTHEVHKGKASTGTPRPRTRRGYVGTTCRLALFTGSHSATSRFPLPLLATGEHQNRREQSAQHEQVFHGSVLLSTTPTGRSRQSFRRDLPPRAHIIVLPIGTAREEGPHCESPDEPMIRHSALNVSSSSSFTGCAPFRTESWSAA